MWNYTDKVKDHFFNPRNAGPLAGANAVGDVGSISCGDALRLSLKIDPESERILDAGFQTFGCGSAIASSSALTEMVKGKTLDEALLIDNKLIADYLDGLPPEKMHCSVMGCEALQAAIANYRGQHWCDNHEEGELICKCFAVDAPMIERTIRANNLKTVEEVINFTKAGGGCTTCHEAIEELLVAVNSPAESDDSVPVQQAADSSPGTVKRTVSAFRRMRCIEEAIASFKPVLAADNGDIELEDIDGDTVYVKLLGGCNGCGAAAVTLTEIQQRVIEQVGEPVRLVVANA